MLQKWMKFLFYFYILLVIKVIIFKYPYEQLYAIMQTWRRDVILEGLGTANFIPFKTIKMYIEYADRLNSFENLAGNILAFIPFGLMFPIVRARKKGFADVLLNALVFVIGIEVFQLFSAFGAFDVDDIILNCFGVILGYIVYRKSRELIPGFDKLENMEEEKYGDYVKEN